MLLPLGMGVLALAGYVARRRRQTGVLTEARLDQLVAACTYVEDPAKLRALATAYDQAGLKPQGEILRKRAALRELPKEAQAARRAVFEKAMASTKVEAMIGVAKAYESEGCFAAAKAIRDQARGVQALKDAERNAPMPKDAEKKEVVNKDAAAA